MWMVNDLVFALSNLVIFSVGAYLWYEGALTIGAVYLLFNYKDLLLSYLLRPWIAPVLTLSLN